MKKLVVGMLLLLLFSVPAFAKDLVVLPTTFDQATFKDLSTDLGLAISYYPLEPAGSLAGTVIPFGFDAGLEVTAVQLDTKKPQWALMKAAGGMDVPSTLPIPKLHVQAGFKIPFLPPIDLGVVYSKIPTTSVSITGGEVKVGLLEDGIVMPAVALRASMTKLAGLEKTIDLSTQQVDLSVSKKFLILTPYLGYGIVKIKSTPKDPNVIVPHTSGGITIPGLTAENITKNKLFGGLKLSLGLINFVLEVDKSAVTAYSGRFNVSF